MQFLVCPQYLSVKVEWDQRCRHLAPPCSCDPDTGSPDQSWAELPTMTMTMGTRHLMSRHLSMIDLVGQTTLDTDLVRLDYITSWMERFHCFEGISALVTAVALKALHYCEGNDAPDDIETSTCPAPEVLLMCWHLCFILACFTFHCSSGANSAESLQLSIYITLHSLLHWRDQD